MERLGKIETEEAMRKQDRGELLRLRSVPRHEWTPEDFKKAVQILIFNAVR